MENIVPQIKARSLELLRQGEIRVRIAPSPTGYLHLGTARAALFNFLYAKKNKGTFILRIEDTDQERSKKEFENDIFEGLKWLGIEWDEGPVFPQRNSQKYSGPFEPYRQSEREEIYERYIRKLLNENKAYRCFCSENDLEAQRQYQMGRGEPPKYNKACSQIATEKAEKMEKEGRKFVIRLRVPSRKVKFDDMIRGDVEIDSSTIGDIVIAKSVRTPLYNLAVVIDDFEMEITHVIRGEDHISNTPKQIIIAEALEISRPSYAHLPLVLGTDRSKLSKRHGAVSVTEYKKMGYLSEAMINFMAFLGWNPGTDREIYTLPSLIKDFSIEKIQKSGAVFNVKKLDFLNSFYIRQKSIERLTELCIPYLLESGLIKEEEGSFKNYKSVESGEKISQEFIHGAVAIHQDRMKVLSEISEFADFLFKDEILYDKELLVWKDMTDSKLEESLDIIGNILSEIEEIDWNKEEIEKRLMPEAEKTGNRGALLWPMRVALTGKKASAGPFEIAEIMGKKKTLERISRAKEKI